MTQETNKVSFGFLVLNVDYMIITYLPYGYSTDTWGVEQTQEYT